MKNQKTILFAVLLIITMCIYSSVSVFAYEGFEIEAVSPAEELRLLEICNFSIHTEKIEKTHFSEEITSFDISASGKIALGLKNGVALILDTDGNILWWLTFNNRGTTFVQWEEENLLVARNKFSCLYEFTKEGSYKKSSFIVSGSQVNNSARLDILNRHLITVGEDVFAIKKGMNFLSNGYSKLIRTDSSGNKTVLYDTEHSATVASAFGLGMIILFLIVTCSIIIASVKNKESKGQK